MGADVVNIYVFILIKKYFPQKAWLAEDGLHCNARWSQQPSHLSLKTPGKLCDTHIVQFFVQHLWFEGRWHLPEVQWAVEPEAVWEWMLHLFQCLYPQYPSNGTETHGHLSRENMLFSSLFSLFLSNLVLADDVGMTMNGWMNALDEYL